MSLAGVLGLQKLSEGQKYDLNTILISEVVITPPGQQEKNMSLFGQE